MQVSVTTLDLTFPANQPTQSVMWNINDPLFRAGEPVLVDSYEMIDQSTWEFTMKEGIEFHNGMPLTSDDVKYTVDIINDPDREPYSPIKMKIGPIIDHVEVVDDLTFRIHTKNPHVALPQDLIYFTPVPRDYYEDEGLEYVSEHPIGVGPYKFVEWVKDSHVTLEANEDYWQGAPMIDKVTYKFLPELGARLAALRAGEIDIAASVIPEQADQLAEEGFDMVSVPIERTMIVVPNQGVCEPCQNRLVREAMIYAVDREAIAREVLGGIGEVAASMVAPESFGYPEDLESRSFDPDMATELLEEAGFADGFSVTFLASQDRYPKDSEVAQAVTSYLRDVGIDVTLRTLPFSEYITEKEDYKLPGLWMIGWASGNYDGFSNSAWLLKGKRTDWAEQLHPEGDPALDEILNAAETATSMGEREARIKEALIYAHDEALFIPLYRYLDLFAVAPRVQNWEPPADELITVGIDTDIREP